jgi:hypothetical protein
LGQRMPGGLSETHRRWIVALIILVFSMALATLPSYAQEPRRVQGLTGHAEPGDNVFYHIPLLKEGETLYVYVEGISGNLDPFVALSDSRLEGEGLNNAFWGEIERVIEEGGDPLLNSPSPSMEIIFFWSPGRR